MHDKSTRVRGCIEHKGKGCVEDFALLINDFAMLLNVFAVLMNVFAMSHRPNLRKFYAHLCSRTDLHRDNPQSVCEACRFLFSLSSHRHLSISLLFSFRFIHS